MKENQWHLILIKSISNQLQIGRHIRTSEQCKQALCELVWKSLQEKR